MDSPTKRRPVPPKDDITNYSRNDGMNNKNQSVEVDVWMLEQRGDMESKDREIDMLRNMVFDSPKNRSVNTPKNKTVEGPKNRVVDSPKNIPEDSKSKSMSIDSPKNIIIESPDSREDYGFRRNHKNSQNHSLREDDVKNILNSDESASERENIFDSYEIQETLGEGTFGKVKLGVHLRTGEKVAIKILEKNRIKSDLDLKRVQREIYILRKTSHSNCVRMLQLFETNSIIYIVMEYLNGGELFEHVAMNKTLSEPEAFEFFRQTIAGLEYLHNRKISHRDLKPENLLLQKRDNGSFVVKIADFGLSSVMDKNGILRTSCGSLSYAAPEMIRGISYNGVKTDIWSMGIVLFVMICGYLPFDDSNDVTLLRKISSLSYVFPKSISEGAKDLIQKMLVVEPQDRFSIQDILNHPWMRQHRNNMFGVFEPSVASLRNLFMDYNKEVFESLIDLGFNQENILKDFQDGAHSDITASYYLMYEKMQRIDSAPMQNFDFENATVKPRAPRGARVRSVAQNSVPGGRPQSADTGRPARAFFGDSMSDFFAPAEKASSQWISVRPATADRARSRPSRTGYNQVQVVTLQATAVSSSGSFGDVTAESKAFIPVPPMSKNPNNTTKVRETIRTLVPRGSKDESDCEISDVSQATNSTEETTSFFKTQRTSDAPSIAVSRRPQPPRRHRSEQDHYANCNRVYKTQDL